MALVALTGKEMVSGLEVGKEELLGKEERGGGVISMADENSKIIDRPKSLSGEEMRKTVALIGNDLSHLREFSEEIYDRLDEREKKLDAELRQIDRQRLDPLEKSTGRLEIRVEAVEGAVERVEKTQAAHGDTLSQIKVFMGRAEEREAARAHARADRARARAEGRAEGESQAGGVSVSGPGGVGLSVRGGGAGGKAVVGGGVAGLILAIYMWARQQGWVP